MTSAASPLNVAAPSIGPHEQMFPADASQVGAARAFLATILAGCPATDDAVLCLSELASNAIVHSRSREPGGSFTVRAHRHRRRLRVEVTDQGGPWPSPTRPSPDQPTGTPSHPGPDQPTGRGLLIVGQLATRWGRAGHSRTGWTVWCEFELGTTP